MYENLLYNLYGIKFNNIEKATLSAGSDTYFITCDNEKYVMKFPIENRMNNPKAEPELCCFLLNNGIFASEFIKNKFDEFISEDESGRIFHLQKFVVGKTYALNTAPEWLMCDSAQTLGKIHTVLASYNGLAEGIGSNFFRYMTPQNAMKSYIKTLEIAKQYGDAEIENDLIYRIELINKFHNYTIDVDKLSCKSTHGDYFISQLICNESKINAVIDWTTACIHPAVWEIIRSFVYAEPSCINGEINIVKFTSYVNEYLNFSNLTNYDIEIMPTLFYYQIAVCDYYNQYYQSTASNKDIYLHQAVFSTKLMKWFDKNIDELTAALIYSFT